MLKAALKLKDALVLRCSGMTLQHGHDEKGEWLKITYYDEDGADVSERFRLQTPAQRTAFEQLFIRPHTRTRCAATLDHRGGYPRATTLVTPSRLCGGADERPVLAGAGKGIRLRGAFPSGT